MTQLRFIEGEVALANKRRVEILSVETSERIFCRDLKTGKSQHFAARELHYPRKNQKERSVKAPLVLDEEERARVSFRIEVLRPILDCKGKERTRIIKEQVQKHNLARSTIYGWLRTYEHGDHKASALATHKRANRKSRLKGRVLKILNEAISNTFETDQKPIMQRTIEEVQLRCHQKNLSPPSPKTIRKYIRFRDQRQQDQKRHGEKYAREQHDIIHGEFPHAHAPLDVVQMDHSLMDIILVDSSRRHSIGRPWLTLAIDVYSRMIAGFYVSFENPNQFLVGMCLANAMLSKDSWLESLGLDAKNWPVWGKIERLHVDNAMEFRSSGLVDLCQEYGTDLEFRPVKQPHYGGIVERFFRTFEGHAHALPGSTFSNPKERGEYPSEKRAAMTLDEFERFFADWIVSSYHIRPHEGLGGQQPIDVWNLGINGNEQQVGRGTPAKIDEERETILIHAMPTDTRVITRKGIVWDYVHYKHMQFSRLRGKKVKVKRDPRNIKFIWFYDETSEQWLRASSRNLSIPVWNLWEFRAAQKALRESGARYDEHSVFEGMQRREELTEQASNKRRKAVGEHKKSLRTQEMRQKFVSETRKTRGNKNMEIIQGGLVDNMVDTEEEDYTQKPARLLAIRKD